LPSRCSNIRFAEAAHAPERSNMPATVSPATTISRLAPFAPDGGDLRVIIETPQGSRNKFDYDAELGLFKLGGVLPAGAVFPFDFGFVPSTTGGDGDPLDVLVLMDEAAFAGCLVEARLIGVIEAKQTERDGKTTRNDRLVAVPWPQTRATTETCARSCNWAKICWTRSSTSSSRTTR
jgi:inorganic pyrophosphatase